MFTIITEHGEAYVPTIEEALNEAWKAALDNPKLLMIETDQGFIVTLPELDDAFEKRQSSEI